MFQMVWFSFCAYHSKFVKMMLGKSRKTFINQNKRCFIYFNYSRNLDTKSRNGCPSCKLEGKGVDWWRTMRWARSPKEQEETWEWSLGGERVLKKEGRSFWEGLRAWEPNNKQRRFPVYKSDERRPRAGSTCRKRMESRISRKQAKDGKKKIRPRIAEGFCWDGLFKSGTLGFWDSKGFSFQPPSFTGMFLLFLTNNRANGLYNRCFFYFWQLFLNVLIRGLSLSTDSFIGGVSLVVF